MIWWKMREGADPMDIDEAITRIEEEMGAAANVTRTNARNKEGPLARAYTEGRYSGLEDALKIVLSVRRKRRGAGKE